MQQVYSDEEEPRFPIVDLNASIYCRPPPLNMDYDSPQLPINYESKDTPSSNANNKNKYINRINAMIQDGRKDHLSEANKVIPDKKPKCETEDNDLSQKNSDKLAKSRLSAKMSRERKKLYMDMMETQVSNL